MNSLFKKAMPCIQDGVTLFLLVSNRAFRGLWKDVCSQIQVSHINGRFWIPCDDCCAVMQNTKPQGPSTIHCNFKNKQMKKKKPRQIKT